MKKQKLVHYNLDIYRETLSNGLEVNVIPKEGNNIYVTFVTKYGSYHNEFIPNGSKEMFEAPLGVAHFLEHKVFEQKSGEDPFSFYTANGADANASTSYMRTEYLFNGATNFKENLEYLLDFVQEPYFTDENVEKEKGIIEQEIKMYDDIPYFKLFEASLKNTFHNHPLKYPIAGTVDTIRKITKEDLYTCYNTFYNPGNMFLTIVGNVNPKEAINVVKNNQKKKKYPKYKKIELGTINEDDSVVKEYEEINAPVEIPKCTISFKVKLGDYTFNEVRSYLSFFFNLRTGATSLLREKLKNEHAITGGIGFDVIDAGSHILCATSFDSKNPDYVVKEILECIKDKKVTEKELNRRKKTLKSSMIYQSDSVYSICEQLNRGILRYGDVILDENEYIDSLNIDKCREILKTLSFDTYTVTVVKKK